MIYTYHLTIPKNTSQNNPYITTSILSYGIIHQLEIDIPPGCQSEIGIRIKRGKNQLWPSNPNSYFTGDNARISFRENYPLLIAPYELTIACHNVDTVNDHTILIRFGLLRKYLGVMLTEMSEFFEV